MNGRAAIAEMFGTFTLTFVGVTAIVGTGGQDFVVIALAHGLALAAAVYTTGHISGGHINPAVTIAMVLRGKIKRPDAAGHIIGQLAGACVAALIVKSVFPAKAVEAVKYGATLGSPENVAALGAGKTLVLEVIATFLLVTTIFAVAVDPRAAKNVYGFAIGLTVAFEILAFGPFTGASMNPARSFGPALIGGVWDMHWIYWVAPILGGVVAACVYDGLFIGKNAERKQ